MNQLPPILARDYRRHRVWPYVATMSAFAAAGLAAAFIILIVTGYVH